MTIHPYTRLFILPAPPDADNDETEGYEVGDTVHVTGGSIYECRDASTGAAVWEEHGSGSGTGDMTKAVYDPDDDGIVNAADLAGNSLLWNGLPVEPPFSAGQSMRWDGGDGAFKAYTPPTSVALSSVDNEIVLFSGTSGREIRDSGTTLASVLASIAAKQDADADLSAIAGLSPSNDDILQRKAGNWVNRSFAQLITDLTSGLSALFAPIAKGVTNGDAHDHNGGDGGTIAYTSLSGRPPLLIPWGVYTNISPMTTSPSAPYALTFERTTTFVKWTQSCFVQTTNNGSNYWTITIRRITDAAAVATFNTAAGAVNTWLQSAITSFSIASLGTADRGVYIECAKVGAPGPLYLIGPQLEVTV